MNTSQQALLKYSGPTRAQATKEGEEMGLSGPALALFVDVGAQQRHEARVQHVLTAAERWVTAVDGQPDGAAKDRRFRALVAALIALELGGVGGRDGLEGVATARAIWATGMGKGRRQASDGSAWDAALKAALHRLGGFSLGPGEGEPELFGYVGETPDFDDKGRQCIVRGDGELLPKVLPRWSVDVGDLLSLAGDLREDSDAPGDATILRQVRGLLGRELKEWISRVGSHPDASLRIRIAGEAFNQACARLERPVPDAVVEAA